MCWEGARGGGGSLFHSAGHSPYIDFLIALFAHNSHIGILSFLPLRLVLSVCVARPRSRLTLPPDLCSHPPTHPDSRIWAQTRECTALALSYQLPRRLRPVISLGSLSGCCAPPLVFPVALLYYTRHTRALPGKMIVARQGKCGACALPATTSSGRTHTASSIFASETLPLHFCNCLIMPPRHNDAGGKIDCANPRGLPACVTPLELET